MEATRGHWNAVSNPFRSRRNHVPNPVHQATSRRKTPTPGGSLDIPKPKVRCLPWGQTRLLVRDCGGQFSVLPGVLCLSPRLHGSFLPRAAQGHPRQQAASFKTSVIMNPVIVGSAREPGRRGPGCGLVPRAGPGPPTGLELSSTKHCPGMTQPNPASTPGGLESCGTQLAQKQEQQQQKRHNPTTKVKCNPAADNSPQQSPGPLTRPVRDSCLPTE